MPQGYDQQNPECGKSIKQLTLQRFLKYSSEEKEKKKKKIIYRL